MNIGIAGKELHVTRGGYMDQRVTLMSEINEEAGKVSRGQRL